MQCAHCNKPGAQTACGYCRAAPYCSQACAHADWSIHMMEHVDAIAMHLELDSEDDSYHENAVQEFLQSIARDPQLGEMLEMESEESEESEESADAVSPIGRRARSRRRGRGRRRKKTRRKGKRKRKWIGKMNLKKGAFTAQAKRRGLTAKEFMRKVLANPDKYSTTTVRRANLMKTFLKMKK